MYDETDEHGNCETKRCNEPSRKHYWVFQNPEEGGYNNAATHGDMVPKKKQACACQVVSSVYVNTICKKIGKWCKLNSPEIDHGCSSSRLTSPSPTSSSSPTATITTKKIPPSWSTSPTTAIPPPGTTAKSHMKTPVTAVPQNVTTVDTRGGKTPENATSE